MAGGPRFKGEDKTTHLLVAHHRDVVEAVKVGQRLQVVFVLDELLRAAVQQSNVGVGGAHGLRKRWWWGEGSVAAA